MQSTGSELINVRITLSLHPRIYRDVSVIQVLCLIWQQSEKVFDPNNFKEARYLKKSYIYIQQLKFYLYELQGVRGRGCDICVLIEWKPYTLESVQRKKENKMPIDT